MSQIKLMSSDEVTYRLARLFRTEADEPDWPIIAGFAAKRIGESYAKELRRCQEVCQMITEDETRRSVKADIVTWPEADPTEDKK